MCDIRTLGTAVGDAEVAGAGVGGVGAGIVLDGAAALNGGARVHECGTVDGEGTLRIAGVNDSRGGTSEVAGEGLDVVALGLAADAAPCAAFWRQILVHFRSPVSRRLEIKYTYHLQHL